MAKVSTYHLLQSRPYPPLLSIVIPMYNEEGITKSLRPAMEAFMFEIKAQAEVVLVNDGSLDHTLEEIAVWASEDPRIKVIHLSRNFGHQIAVTAGVDNAVGDAVVIMDADLQDPLHVIHEMIACYCEGYDVVYGQRTRRKGESAFRLAVTWTFYRFMRHLVHKSLPVDTGDFRLISRHCLDGLQAMRETHRFLRGMIAWVGYPQRAVLYERDPRVSGISKYPMYKLAMLAWTAATSFSTLPLNISILLGFLVGLFGLEEAIRALLSSVFGRHAIEGWTSLMIVTCIIGCSLLISIGIVGQYIGRIYEEAKGRPLYLIARTFNLPEANRAKRP